MRTHLFQLALSSSCESGRSSIAEAPVIEARSRRGGNTARAMTAVSAVGGWRNCAMARKMGN
jgi:hypothetical protein